MAPTILKNPAIILLLAVAPGVGLVTSRPATGGTLRVSEFGALGDGAHDDGPAITAAFTAAKADGAPTTVLFEKKVYRLGDNPAAWHYFQMTGHEDLVIDGNGATLLCAKGNLGFHFDGGHDITVRGLTFDGSEPSFTQGEVVALDEGGSLDVKIMDGFPEPPDEAFLTANRHNAHGGGGRHMIVFENGGHSRNTRMGSDHLYIRNITRVSPGVFRFHVHEDYLPRFKGVGVGNWVSYGFNKATLPAAEKVAKDQSASIYAQIAADRVENITFEDIDIFGSLNGGIRVSDMPGDVTIRDVRIIRKPGTRNLLSIVSDALHLMNIRGRVLMENCVIEAPGDDCLNIGAQRDQLIGLDASDKRIAILRSTDNWYYNYTIREGDRLQFLDPASKKVLGVRTVTANTFNPGNRAHRVTLDREVTGLVPGTTQVMNLNHITQSTMIRNNTITPYMRNALLARAQNMTIEGNMLDCSRGGVIGLNLSYASGQDDARLRNVRIAGNTFVCPGNVGLVALRPYRDLDGTHDAQGIRIIDNIFQVGSAKAIRISGVKGLHLRANRILKDGNPAESPGTFTTIRNCADVLREAGGAADGEQGKASPHVDHEMMVTETHRASLLAREGVLRQTIAKDSCWPHGAWGDTMWALTALYLNEKVDEANARLLQRASAYIALKRAGAEDSAFKPEEAKETPWAYFALTDYVRILCLFHAKSTHFPGRLQPETEAAMKEALWFWVKKDSKMALSSPDHLLVLLGTENHDLTRRPNHYLVSSILKDDPAYRERPFDDGHTAAEHATAYEAFFREWPRKRAMTGLWFEVGSNTYQKYSWPALFNLHELAPDPVTRKRFGLLLDLAFIEEAQISVRGRRGGGRSRAGYGKNSFESYKNLLYAPEDPGAGSSHSQVIETSRYQLPAAAILLRKCEFPARRPFVIRNRVLGELAPGHPTGDGDERHHAADSALVNYAYRTPHYLLGSTWQNPALSMPDPEADKPLLKYAGISRQNRWCGMLIDDPANDEICAVYPVIEKTRGGRPQHPHWSVQHENVILLQRIAPETSKRIGSYSTGKISIHFHGKHLEKVENGGWIFSTNGKAFVGVKFLDNGYMWNEARNEAGPVDFHGSTDKSRILLHAGDLTTHGSFEQFRAAVLANHLLVNNDKVEYRFGAPGTRIEFPLYDGDHPERFALPRINGNPINLRPPTTYHSPYLNGEFGSDQIDVAVGPLKRRLDFSK